MESALNDVDSILDKLAKDGISFGLNLHFRAQQPITIYFIFKQQTYQRFFYSDDLSTKGMWAIQ